MKKLLFFTVYLLGVLSTAFAKEYKVATAVQFQQAADVVKAGDVIIIADGAYSGWAVTINSNGSTLAPILIRAATPGKVVFSGEVPSTVFTITGKYIQLAGIGFDSCRLIKGSSSPVLVELKASENCQVTGCVFTKNTVSTQFMPIVVISGNGHNNEVDHCRFIGNINNQELQVKITADAVPLYTIIDNNLFKDKDKVNWKVFNGGECVQVGQDPVLLGGRYAYTTVRDNKFIACNGEPEVISNKSSGNKYINNIFENCHGELVMRGGHECTIDSNRFNGGAGGIRINGTHHIITNNTLSGLSTGIRLMYGMSKGKTDIGFYVAASDCTIKSNHIANCETGILIGDSKNTDWTGKFDTTRYPSRTIQDIAPFNNTIESNIITDTKTPVLHNDN